MRGILSGGELEDFESDVRAVEGRRVLREREQARNQRREQPATEHKRDVFHGKIGINPYLSKCRH
jgi:hypothetical protein